MKRKRLWKYSAANEILVQEGDSYACAYLSDEEAVEFRSNPDLFWHNPDLFWHYIGALGEMLDREIAA